jgi:Flp pilus assembly pilin Flp
LLAYFVRGIAADGSFHDCKIPLKLFKDDAGGEVLEYALIAGLIVVAAIAIIGAVGTKVVARWDSLNSSM